MKQRRGLTLIVTILGVVCLLYVWMRIDILRVGYAVDRLEKKKVDLERQHESLQSRYSQLTSPPRLAQEATKKLGLRIPQPGQIVMVTLEPDNPAVEENSEQPVQVAQRSLDRP